MFALLAPHWWRPRSPQTSLILQRTHSSEVGLVNARDGAFPDAYVVLAADRPLLVESPGKTCAWALHFDGTVSDSWVGKASLRVRTPSHSTGRSW